MNQNQFLVISGLLIVLASFVFKPPKIPRGIRNKNPGNIRFNPANDWLGQIGVDEDGFVIFDKFENGIRAMGKILDSYRRRGLDTVGEIITTYAPSNENDTDAYITNMENNLGISANTRISRNDGNFAPLIASMILQENGQQPFTQQFIEGALAIS